MIGRLLDNLRHARLKDSGRRGEDLAHRFLRRRGYTIVARNYRLSSGEAEADLIAWDRDKLVIVEVKTRDSGAYGPPERAISEEKRRRILRIARAYAQKIELPWERVRFDVVTVVLSEPPEIHLYVDALSTRTQ